MKYLENDKLTELTSDLSDAVLGHSHRVINGKIEAYTMKRAGGDKKLAYALGQKFIAEIEEMHNDLAETVERRKQSASTSSVGEALTKKPRTADSRSQSEGGSGRRSRAHSFDFVLETSSPKTTLGDFSEISTRKLFTDIILTLNASFPDYDFSNAKPGQFERLGVETVRSRIYERLAELASFKPHKNWLTELWMAVNDVVDLRECELYSYNDEIEEDALWSFHYFFINKSLRRIVFFTCSERIDEVRQAEEGEEKVLFYPSEAQVTDDFDWVSDIAGGVALPISTP